MSTFNDAVIFNGDKQKRMFKETPNGQTHCDMDAELKARVAYHQRDHTHCFDQGGDPACGQSLDKHAMCCLCAITRDNEVI